ncbi:hypothetical protein F3I62_18765 [Pseudomonas sp. R-28-1W-6]|uniref:hypothetical protein n=1 Tax=Pseudomonas sp. R-28-1W-6 TaxID=2650101 RepID=UPI001366479A|nr:hypothetical protein [Pseudomonas sp. R-28-1W-6]MWV14147.1 hypothetical protein [Pseudomonas sp. R-28-1W-6]
MSYISKSVEQNISELNGNYAAIHDELKQLREVVAEYQVIFQILSKLSESSSIDISEIKSDISMLKELIFIEKEGINKVGSSIVKSETIGAGDEKKSITINLSING